MHIKNRNALIFILISFFQNCWFTEGVWYFYWGRFSNYFQLGIMFTILTAVWIFAKIPTGLFADKYGRKRATVIGFLVTAFGSVLVTLSRNIWWLSAGGFFENIGRAFVSGSLETLLFDSLKKEGAEDKFPSLLARRTQIGIFAFSIAVIIGGFLYQIYYRLPFAFYIGTSVIAATLALFLKEVPLTYTETSKNSNIIKFVEDMKAGFKQLIGKDLKPYLIPIFSIVIVTFLYDWGFSRPSIALSFGYDSKTQPIIFACMSVLAALLVGFFNKIRKRTKDCVGLNALNLLIGTGFILSYLKLGYFGVLVMLLIELTWNLAEPWISVIINNHIESTYRATTLSTVQFVSKIPFLFINILIGESIDTGYLRLFHLTLGSVIVVLGTISFIKYRKTVNNEKQSLNKMTIEPALATRPRL